VISAKFNHDGTLVATADMAGTVQVWKVASQERLLSDVIGELNVSFFLNFSMETFKILIFISGWSGTLQST